MHQAPLSMGFSRQEYWSGLPFLSPGIIEDIPPDFKELVLRKRRKSIVSLIIFLLINNIFRYTR